MNGARVLVTGPTSGLGKQIASQLASRGAEVVLDCRDVERGNQTATEISQGATAAQPAVIPVDTSSQASIRKLAHEYGKRHDRLDVLVNIPQADRLSEQTDADRQVEVGPRTICRQDLCRRAAHGQRQAASVAQ